MDDDNQSIEASSNPSVPILDKEEKSHNKFLAIFGAVLILFFLASIAIVVNIRNNTKDTPINIVSNINTIPTSSATIEPTVSKQQECTLEAPKLFPETGLLTWAPPGWQEKSLREGGLYIDGEPFDLNGEEKVVEYNDVNLEEMEKLRKEFRKYYSDKLRDWETSVKVDGKSVSPIFTDDPGGSIWGYVKVCKGNVRAIILQEQIPTDLSEDSKENYFLRNRVFISEMIDLCVF